MKNQTKQTATATFRDGTTLKLKARHFCGGSQIKLPLNRADFRQQWITLTPGSKPHTYVTPRGELIKVLFS